MHLSVINFQTAISEILLRCLSQFIRLPDLRFLNMKIYSLLLQTVRNVAVVKFRVVNHIFNIYNSNFDLCSDSFIMWTERDFDTSERSSCINFWKSTAGMRKSKKAYFQM